MATTMKKRMFALAAMLLLLVAMAVSAFAEENTEDLAGTIRRYDSYNGQTGCGFLNAYPLNGQGVIRGTPLRIWNATGSSDQNFKAVRTVGGYLVLMVQTAPPGGTQYSLMINRSSSNGSAILWSGVDAFFDSNMICSKVSENSYRFHLANHNDAYLNATGGSNGSVINFASNVSRATSSLWKAYYPIG